MNKHDLWARGSFWQKIAAFLLRREDDHSVCSQMVRKRPSSTEISSSCFVTYINTKIFLGEIIPSLCPYLRAHKLWQCQKSNLASLEEGERNLLRSAVVFCMNFLPSLSLIHSFEVYKSFQILFYFTKHQFHPVEVFHSFCSSKAAIRDT